jgi:radical SAM superfamily enzyme YgiQ (UPF0313 family)
MIQLMSARGCSGKCSFCVYPQTIHEGKLRCRSAYNIADEFEWIKHNMPEIREIGFEDDTFTADRKRVSDFCHELIRRNLKIKWYCNVRVDLDYYTMVLMKKAGCKLLIAGYESADDQVLENIKKRINKNMILDFSRNARRAKLLVHGCFMVGNRGESKETINKTLNLALKLKDDTVQFFPLIVYPGTSDYTWAIEEGLIEIQNYADYLTKEGMHKSIVHMKDMSSSEITKWCNMATRRYYLRIQYILYKLKQIILHPSELRRTLISFKNYSKFIWD